ncbi:putative small molecule binding protein (contains 3H domain) [Halobacteroides halobius DSM 5150]|uniref:Putative small molecule binding protein (Contains 3H domain) n=1 Tax=Halobacteroides halobius (strain ATCC 35273 / DSM 5150 / MD-1) TaxID=748449 RepID=L0KAG6_HALHC|nr:transcription repressor NadR [Halobacteroides halobius]AGB41098.1 putative small molecule binding protein (contains 3H domain) [Halobacteroides halobius DSM 5150]
MSAGKRRKKLLSRLQGSDQAITGSTLAKEFDVSRQVIVQDVALLRAKGEQILATSQGYIIEDETRNNLPQLTIACQHDDSVTEIKEELATIIKYGGRIKDVIIEHPIYGQLRGLLTIQSQSDLDSFLQQYQTSKVKALSSLTKGIHLHTIEALNQEVLELIKDKLEERGYLLTE